MFHHHFHHISSVSSGGGFWESFFSNLFAGVIIAGLSATLIPAYLDWRKKPKLEFRNRVTRTDECTLTEAQDGHWEGTFALVVRNEGAVTQRDVFWHILVPSELDTHLISFETGLGQRHELMQGAGRTWKRFSGKMEDPIFSKRGTSFPYKLTVKTSTTDAVAYKVYYYFSTEFGIAPETAENVHRAEAALGKSADEVVDPEDLGKIILKPENMGQ